MEPERQQAEQQQSSPRVAGVDVAKARLDAFVEAPGQHPPGPARGEARGFDNDDAGVAALAAWLAERRVTLVVVEATGAYERAAAVGPADAGLEVAVVNPRRVRRYADAAGVGAKTDAVDARLLAAFGRAVGPRPTPRPSDAQQRLAAPVARRRQVVGMRAQELNRQGRADDAFAAPLIKAHLRQLDAQVAQLDKEIAKLLGRDDDWRAKADIMRSAPGVGAGTASALPAALPEIGRLDDKQITALAGLAPFANDSGTRRGKRRCRGGRVATRAAPYMAAVTARRCNVAIRAFAERLAARGKTFKELITACMRKLLVTLNAMVKANKPWEDRCPAT